ncbi:MAG: hypothetical protein ACT4NL_00460 [Pseudomarimonas sp.]
MFRQILIFSLLMVATAVASAVEPDARWPDFQLQAGETTVSRSGSSEYFQGFESPCFGAPYNPSPEDDWIRFYSEVTRVASGSGGIASRNGFFHAELLPPLPGAPANTSGAFTRLGGYASSFDGGFTVEVDVYLDLTDPQVLSGINADYGFDVSSAVNTQAGGHRRDFIFHAASNTAGQVLIGASNTSTFSVRGNLASGPHFVVTSSGWYTFQWVYRDAGNGTLAVDTNLLSMSGTQLWTQTSNNLTDVIATQIGGNRYLWFLFLESNRVAIDNSRINSGVLTASFGSTPIAGSTLNAGSAAVGSPAPGANLLVRSLGTLRLEVCSCAISGPAAADFSVATCPAIIEPNATLNLSIGCTPSANGARNASVLILTNDSAAGPGFTFPLTCNGGVIPAPAIPPVMVPSQSTQTLWSLVAMFALFGVIALRRMR